MLFRKIKINILKKIKSLLNPKLNFYAEQFLWKYRHLIIPKRMTDFGEHKGIRRRQLVELVKSKEPFINLLDIGCGNGINIDILSKEIPDSQFHGIDINKYVIRNNKRRSEEKTNCEFYVRNINDLFLFKENSFDYIITDSVLIYHSPKSIIKILSEFIRISSKGVILREQNSDNLIYKGHWIHNYSKILEDLKIKKYKIIKTYGQKGLWSKYGYIIDIDL